MYSTISAENLSIMLAAAPNLKTLDLYFCNNLSALVSLVPGSLQFLESVNLANSNMASENIKALLLAAPNLKSLDLYGCKNPDSLLSLAPGSLQSIESITLVDSSIASFQLISLLAASPNLKRLNLGQCKNINGLMNLVPGSLKFLESVDLDNSMISSESLKALLLAAPNLKYLNCNRCYHISQEIMLDPKQLNSLESLELSKSSISSKSLSALLLAAPRLKKVDLEDCSLLEDLTLEPDSLSSLECEVNARGHRFTQRNQELLYAAAPKIKEKNLLKTSSLFENITRPVTAPIRVDPTHKPSDFKQANPTPDEGSVSHDKQNVTQNQGMIIGKLSQYLLKTNQHRAHIPKLQNGICVPLSYFFKEKPRAQWDDFIRQVSAWDVDTLPDKSLTTLFDELYHCIEEHQFKPQITLPYYLGDNCLAGFESLGINQTAILNNPRHAIAVRRISPDRFDVYDPNYVAGVKTITQMNLSDVLNASIGKLVGFSTDAPLHIKARITSPDNFIEEGGLLALCNSSNAEDMLDELKSHPVFSKKSLDGLLMVSADGVPAWVIGLKHANLRIRELTTSLVAQLDNPMVLQKSLEGMPGFKKQQLTTAVIQDASQKGTSSKAMVQDASQQGTSSVETPSEEIAHLRQIVQMIRLSNQPHYEQQLATWENKTAVTGSLDEYCQMLVSPLGNTGEDKRKTLVKLDSTDALDSLSIVLKKYCEKTSRPVFYIDNPDDLLCYTPCVVRHSMNQGTLTNGPVGPLHDFLKAAEERGESPILLVNYERFNADDMVRFNGLLDKNRHADRRPLPESAVIIGLMNTNKPDCYQGSDFYSRFNEKETCPLSLSQINEGLPKLGDILDVPLSDSEEKTIINLYHSPDWESRLLGYWVINGQSLVFQKGALQEAIEKNKPIEIQNGPWGDEDFERFIHLARSHGVRHAGETVLIPASLLIYRTEGYDWAPLKKQVQIESNLEASDIPVLNPTTLGELFGRYEYRAESKSLERFEGLIAEAPAGDRAFHVNVTSTLSDDAWAMVLSECARHQRQLIAHCAPHVSLPDALKLKKAVIKPIIAYPWDLNASNSTEVIQSSDIDTTVETLTSKSADWQVIDVSECNASDLLLKLDASLHQNLHFEFSESKGALLTALEGNKKVILKGRFSKALSDALAYYLLKREHAQSSTEGQLVLVTESALAFDYLSTRAVHAVSVAEKISLIEAKYPGISKKLTEDMLEKESLSQLYARASFLSLYPDGDSVEAWRGMLEAPAKTSMEEPFDINESAEKSALFIEARRKAVHQRLANNPCVFLTGLSGVGKSTFVELQLSEKNDALFVGEDRLKEWAESVPTGGRQILFLDEVNLSLREWSELEGLFQTPPGLLINGHFYPLSPDHKVVFAGNPISYGDERRLAPFFERHGQAVWFEPLSKAVIYEQVLKPIFNDQHIAAEDVARVSKKILEAYQFICNCSTSEILISPRELQMMALLALSNYNNDRTRDLDSSVEAAIFEVGQSLPPRESQALFATQFKPKVAEVLSSTLIDNDFLVTPSRQGIFHQLQERLRLCEWRKGNPKLSDAQKYGGLGALILEGEPGIGKSELAIKILREHGYEEEHSLKGLSTKPKPFYIMPVSLNPEEKEALLTKAFDEGAIVLIDEMNSSPMMEQFLNSLLMGKHPSAKRADPRPASPGFMVIGTQNPINMAGRRVASTALQRRMTRVELSNYTHDEMLAILIQKGIEAQEAKAMVDAYEKQVIFAATNHLSPAPCCRDLLSLTPHLALMHPDIVTPVDEAVPEPSSALNSVPIMLQELEFEEAKDVSLQPLAPSSALNSVPIMLQELEFEEAKDVSLQALAPSSSIEENHASQIKTAKQQVDNFKVLLSHVQDGLYKNNIKNVFFKVLPPDLPKNYQRLFLQLEKIYKQIDRLDRNAMSFFSKGNIEKANNIRRQIIKALEADIGDGNIIKNPAVAEALAAHRLSFKNPIGADGSIDPAKSAKSYTGALKEIIDAEEKLNKKEANTQRTKK